MNIENNSLSTLDKLILRHVPTKFYENQQTVYDKLMGICLYVSLLTDSKAQMLNQLISKN
jgi:dGTPase